MSRLDLLQIECERGNFHHVNDTSESKEMSMQFCADMKDALIELSTLTAKVAELEKRLEVAHYNIELRTKENHDIINNHDESRWTYWRKRSGEMTDAWRDQRDSALNLTAKVKRYEEIIEKLTWQNKQYKTFGTDDCENYGMCQGRITLFYHSKFCIECSPSDYRNYEEVKLARAALNQGEGK